jgi:hypothetical protein
MCALKWRSMTVGITPLEPYKYTSLVNGRQRFEKKNIYTHLEIKGGDSWWPHKKITTNLKADFS